MCPPARTYLPPPNPTSLVRQFARNFTEPQQYKRIISVADPNTGPQNCGQKYEPTLSAQAGSASGRLLRKCGCSAAAGSLLRPAEVLPPVKTPSTADGAGPQQISGLARSCLSDCSALGLPQQYPLKFDLRPRCRTYVLLKEAFVNYSYTAPPYAVAILSAALFTR